MKNNTLKALGIMVLSATLLFSTVTGCGSKETADVPATEVIEAVVETETVVPETEAVTEATEEVVTEDIELVEITETVEATEVVEETEVAEETPTFTVTDMSATKYAKQAVKVRKGPSTEYEQLGSLSTNQQVTVTGQADTGWYRIEYKGEEGYVSNKFLVDQKVVVTTPAQNTQTQNQSTGTTDNTQAQAQTPVTDNSGWTGDTSTSTPSTSTPSTDTSAPVVDNTTPAPALEASTPSTDTGSSDVTLDNWWEAPEYSDLEVFDPSTNPEVEGMGGGIF